MRPNTATSRSLLLLLLLRPCQFLNTQEGGFVPECIRRPEIGLDLEIFNANAAADIQERMTNFNELHFYDGTLSTNLTLEEAHVKIGFMLKVVLLVFLLHFLNKIIEGR